PVHDHEGGGDEQSSEDPEEGWTGKSHRPAYRQAVDGCLGGISNVQFQLDTAAARMASIGGSKPVQRWKLSAPWRTRTSSPSTVRAPPRAAQARRGVGSSP